MNRLAYLPDLATLTSMCQRVRGPRHVLGNLGSVPVVTAALREAVPSSTRQKVPALGTTSNAKTLPPTRESLLTEMDLRLENTTTLDQRFTQLLLWLETQAEAKAVFVTDAEGLAMAESNARESYLAAAGELGGVLEKLFGLLPDVASGSTTLQLRSGGNVELLWCDTRLGRFAIGLVLDRPLEPIWSTMIPSALEKVLAIHP